MLRSSVCFFFLSLSPSGAERPDFFPFLQYILAGPLFSDRKKITGIFWAITQLGSFVTGYAAA